MSTFYYHSTNASDLGGGADFSDALTTNAGTLDNLSISVRGGDTETSYTFTPSGDPGASGATGNYTVDVQPTVANSNVHLSVQLHRISADGTAVLGSSSTSAEQTLSDTTTKVFTFTNVDLGTWLAGHRLRVDYNFRSSSSHGNDTFEIQRWVANASVDTPWGAISRDVGLVTETDLAQTITADVTHIRNVGQTTETDLAQTITVQLGGGQEINVGQTTETDTSQTTGRSKSKTLALAW